MTSVIGDKLQARPAQHRWTRGFTLIELLLSVALLGLMASLCIAATVSLFDGKSGRGADVFWDAVSAARDQAVASGHIVRLVMGEGGQSLRLEDGSEPRDFALPVGNAIRVLPGELGDQPAGGPPAAGSNTPVVYFYPDGTCDKFRVELSRPSAAPQLIVVDPWTCAAPLSASATTGS